MNEKDIVGVGIGIAYHPYPDRQYRAMRTCFLFVAASYANPVIAVKLLRLVIVLPILTCSFLYYMNMSFELFYTVLYGVIAKLGSYNICTIVKKCMT
ncbi:hypothetical protein E2986_12314 [Frieseomelitta varia]|uniref:Uncharacterized protein n=1 Tax=Frieseomelitta varia TaxID=561572 RepID=A0A833R8U0_9HYME|nr:hypothetical protein E2986_12314 [Frieseomelitta varia]